MWLVRVVIRRYIDILIIIINFPYPLVLGLFLAAASLLLCSFLNVFSVFVSIKCAMKIRADGLTGWLTTRLALIIPE